MTLWMRRLCRICKRKYPAASKRSRECPTCREQLEELKAEFQKVKDRRGKQ